MTHSLSLLDKSPIAPNETATAAIARTINLAKLADDLGFKRFWLAEHHNSRKVACSSPEILIAHILAHTKKIRVGSGGVMLQHYSPYKVAENFNLLSSLAPDRIDIGVGKAPGGSVLSTRALQQTRDGVPGFDFEIALTALSGYLDKTSNQKSFNLSTSDDESESDVLYATPLPDIAPEKFLLGASVASAELAARSNWKFVYAAHINGDLEEVKRALHRYRELCGQSAILAIAAVVSEDSAFAAHVAGRQKKFYVRIGNEQPVNVSSLKQAELHIRQAKTDDYQIEQRNPLVVHGQPNAVRSEIDRLVQVLNIDEVIVDTPISEDEERIQSIRLLSSAANHIEKSHV